MRGGTGARGIGAVGVAIPAVLWTMVCRSESHPEPFLVVGEGLRGTTPPPAPVSLQPGPPHTDGEVGQKKGCLRPSLLLAPGNALVPVLPLHGVAVVVGGRPRKPASRHLMSTLLRGWREKQTQAQRRRKPVLARMRTSARRNLIFSFSC